MPRLSFRRIIRRPITLLPLLINIAVLLPTPANAELYTTNGANDFYFTIETQQQFTVRAYASQYGIDSMLWLYDAAEQQLAANDDYFGLDSYISISLPAGTYRLRTGVCCGDPNRWYGTSYQIDTSFAVVGGVAVTTTTSTTSTTTTEPPTTITEPPTTTTQEPTTTTEASTTTVAPPTTETTEVPTTVPEPTTTSTVSLPTSTEPEPTTTTSELPPTSTTQPDVPETASTTTSTVAEPTTTQAPETTLPPETTTSSTSTSTTVKVPTVTTSSEPIPMRPVVTTQPVVVAPTTTTTSEPAPRSEQVGSTTTVPPTTVPFTVPEVVVELPPAEVLAELPVEQLQEVFESINMESLTPEQQDQLIEQLTSAPDEVKEEFEETINVFSGGFDTYVPTGSTIDVGTRRVIVAVSSVLSVLPIPSSAPPSAPTSGPTGGAPSDGGGTTSEEKPRRSRRGRI